MNDFKENKITSGDDLVNHLSNYVHDSNIVLTTNIPEICKDEPCILGVDEAGRGPVLGPMVYGISFCVKSRADEFAALGFKDSKALTEEKREELFKTHCACDDYTGWSVDIISPNFISNKMLQIGKQSLNEIAEDSTVNLIQQVINKGVKVAEIFVDTVGPPQKYQDRLSNFFPECIVTVAKKADSLYPIVSAASICAKVTRDRVIHNWKFPENVSVSEGFGSGYPNDPLTKKFLEENMDDVFGFPNLVRFSWSTASRLLEEKAARVDWEDDEPVNVTSFRKFFTSQANTATTSHTPSYQFFKDIYLSNVSKF